MFVGSDNLNPMVHCPQYVEGESSPFGYYQICDDFTQQDFARNYGGHPRSDIALLEEQQDLTYVNNLLSRLNERKPDGVGDDVTDADLSVAFKSKYCQTASEKIKYYENLLKVRDDRELEALEGKERDSRAAELAAQRERLRNTLNAEEKEYLRKLAREREIESLID